VRPGGAHSTSRRARFAMAAGWPLASSPFHAGELALQARARVTEQARARGCAVTLNPKAPWATERSLNAEIAMLSRFKHENIIRLWGFCAEPAGQCLVYELGVRGALSCNLVADTQAADLSWKTRIRIARGIACALSYLHRSDPPAWHRDDTAANVVLAHRIAAAQAHRLRPVQAADG
jgi:serine/threonine protein kinase